MQDEIVNARLVQKGVFDDLIEIEILPSGGPQGPFTQTQKMLCKIRVFSANELRQRIKDLLQQGAEPSFGVENSRYPYISFSLSWWVRILLAMREESKV